jgi:23S rRNA pseudouridine1911/1915/1917 synthase
MNIKTIYEDEDIIVLDKPSGVTVNNAETTRGQETVQDFLKEKFPLSGKGDSDFFQRDGIVHRIDKETSGILVVARNQKSFENLQEQFKERKVEKTYIALVHGRVDIEEGDISVPIGRLPWNRKRFGVLSGGKEAVTHFRVKERFGNSYSLLEVNPKTGRTHQIRVHLKYFNHPIFGDNLYAGRKTSRNDRVFLERFFLHAQKISFYHPKTGEKVSYISPLSKELEEVINSLRIDFEAKS